MASWDDDFGAERLLYEILGHLDEAIRLAHEAKGDDGALTYPVAESIKAALVPAERARAQFQATLDKVTQRPVPEEDLEADFNWAENWRFEP